MDVGTNYTPINVPRLVSKDRLSSISREAIVEKQRADRDKPT